MIVKDKQKTLELAHNISSRIIKELLTDVTDNIPEDDPAEYIYLVTHTVACLVCKAVHILSGYGNTYAIPQTSVEHMRNMINYVLEEYISANTHFITHE